jgi:hypothetical protein
MIYKNIEIKNYKDISEKVYDYVVKKTSILNGEHNVWNNLNKEDVFSYVPELYESFQEMGKLIPMQLTIFKIQPTGTISIHTDGGKHSRLLWPIKNCEGSYTKFFKVEESNIERITNTQHKSSYGHIKNPELAELVHSVELTQPIVFKPWVPHGIWTNPTIREPRLTLTVFFDKTLDFLLT